MLRQLLGALIAFVIVIVYALAGALAGESGYDGGAQMRSRSRPDYPCGVDVAPDEAAERKIAVPFERVLTPDARELPYRSSRERLRPQLHIGQRKLLLNEIEFLTLHGDKSDTVVYVGSAPGTHDTYLLKLFPRHKFVLYDPREFHKSLHNNPRIILKNQFFTDADAAEWTGKDVLFISDIRTGSIGEEWDAEIIQNMEMQRKWVEIAKPAMAMLKFRLSWEKPIQNYLDGEIRLQPWQPITSTETRLLTDGKTSRDWDTIKYEQQMYRFNTVTRIAWYDIPDAIVSRVPGMDHCHDCASEVEILRNYERSKPDGGDPSDESIALHINRITKLLGRTLDVPPHGLKRDIRDITARAKAICGVA